jgi:hypothetical protein
MPRKKEGGKLSVSQFKNLLNASYDDKADNINGYVKDSSISTNTSKVYYNPETRHTVVAHRGTAGISDWANNAVYGLLGEKYYKKTPRYKEAKSVQENAVKKYGKDSITTIGHSQGSIQSQLLGNQGREIINLNKATRPSIAPTRKNKNQYDIRASSDIVSALNPFEKKNGNELTIRSKLFDPLNAHKINVLDKLDGDMIIGNGVIVHPVNYLSGI